MAHTFDESFDDFGRGVIATNDPTTAGVYSPSTDNALMLQPTGTEIDGSNGFIEARNQNTSGATAADIAVNFDWAARSSAPVGQPGLLLLH